MNRNSGGKGPSQRQLRVGEMVRHALTEILQRGEIPDPEIERTVISVTEVGMSPDLKIATVYISPLGVSDPQPIIKALARNQKLIRGKVSPALRQMKYMPEFRFRADTSFENYAKIDKLLHSPEVARDLDDGEGEDE
ncbi:MAG: 30S ribosome-binding factor RbfA [Nitratireductor sp.]|nr:30S ribosome-binding factor RbfA [Nitratireductor sp.]